MFAALIAGKQVQTDFQQVSEVQFITTFPLADTMNHVVVFLTGQIPLPDQYGAAVYFGLPLNGEMQWYYLGFVSNKKPSAIFKVSQLKSNEIVSNPFLASMGAGIENSTFCQLGIALEPLSQLVGMSTADNVEPSTLDNFSQFTTKMLDNFVNYVASFANDQQYVHLSVVQHWFENFKRKIQHNPNFWKS